MARKYDGPSPEEVLTNDLIALLESADTPKWRRPWTPGSSQFHRNFITGTEYHGQNPILLTVGQLLRDHPLPLWCGATQAKEKGWHPAKGSKSTRILRPQLNKFEKKDDDGKPVLGPDGEPVIGAWTSYKVVPVFNIGDLVGFNDEATAALEAIKAEANGVSADKVPAQRLELAERQLESWEVETRFGGAVACYSPGADRIAMPLRESFETVDGYCATWLHEQAHSTGHSSRLNRKDGMGAKHGSRAYAYEELVAELASVLGCYRLQVGCEITQHAAYLASWIGLLKEGPKVLLRVLADARKAADLIAPEGGDEHGDESPRAEAEAVVPKGGRTDQRRGSRQDGPSGDSSEGLVLAGTAEARP